MPQDILITPNKGSATTQGKIDFTGKGASASTITLKVLDDSSLSFEGTAGQLFSITPVLASGTIFSVNDVSGIPMIDVDASGLVRLAPLGGTVYSNTLYAVPRTVAGSGNSVTVRAADGLTSGAGGNILLLPGLQATTGGDGKIIVRQPGGTAGTNEVQMWHDGSQFHIKNFTAVADYGTSSSIILKSSNDFGVQIGRVGPSTVGVYPVGTSTIAIGNPSSQTVYAGWWYSNFYSGAWEPSNSTYPINWTDVGFYRGSVRQLVVGNYSSGGGSLCYTSSTPSALSTNPTNDLALSGSAFQRLSSSSALAVTGIAPPSGGAHVDGRVMWLHNVGSFNITLKHDATSTAENRFVTETAGDFILGPRRAVQCTYDTATARWRVIGAVNYPYNFPTTDGTSGQVLSTNGGGTLSWANASSGTGTVTSVSGTGTVNGITLTGTVTSTGNLTLGGSLSNVSLTSQVTGTLPIANGGTNATTALTANANIVDWGQLINHNTIADFNNVQRWGCAFVTGTANGPGVNSASQYYQMMYSLGADYSWGSANVYAMQMAIPRSVTSPYVTVRYKEGGGATAGWGSWQKISAGYADTAGSATSATSATTATNATNVAVTADSTNATRYISFVGATSGNNGTLANSTLTYNPSTGNVGIGTASPNNILTLYRASGSLALALQTGSSTYAYFATDGTDGILASAVGSTGQKFRWNLNAPDNALYLSSTGAFGINSTSPGAKLHVETGAAGTKGLIVKAAANPTANLLEVQNSSGTNLVYVDPSGDLVVGVPNATYFPSGAAAPLHVTRPTTAVATAIAAWPTYEPDTQTHARVTAFFTDGGNGGTATVATGTTTIIKFGEYYTGRVVLMPEGAGGQTPADQNSGAGRDIMLLGGKSDNTAGKTGGRVFIQGGTGFAGAYGSNFGNVILQANGGAVCIGGTSPVSTSPGLDITADASSSATGQLMIKRASTNDRFRLTCGVHTSNYAFIKAYENSIGAINLAIQPDVGSVGIGNTSPGAKLQVDTGAAATKGLIVKGAASQSANLQEWQNSGGTVLANLGSTGSFYCSSDLDTGGAFYQSTGWYGSYLSRVIRVEMSANFAVGNYIEIFRIGYMSRVNILMTSFGDVPEPNITKSYSFISGYAIGGSGILQPEHSFGNSSSYDVDLEYVYSGGWVYIRARRTASPDITKRRWVVVRVEAVNGNGSFELSSGTGASALTSYLSQNFYSFNNISSPPPALGTGAGTNLTISASSGVTSGAGGSIILQPGAQATTGGNGSIRFINPSNTAQYFYIAPSTSALDIGLVGISNDVSTGGINFNGTNIRGLGTVNTAALFAGSFYAQGSTLRATNGTSVQLGSSNGTSTDNINYIWMRQNGHIAWYGDIGLRRDGVGVLSVTNGSTGGGSLAYKSNTTNISTATNNLVLNGSAFQRLNCTAACNLTGVAPPSGSHIDGRMMRIYNVGTANLTLKHNSTSSAVANRFCCVQAVDIILAPRDYAELIYDGTDGGLVGGQNNPCWRVH